MNQRRKTTIILVGIILAILVICGFLGYANDPRRISGAVPGNNAALSATKILLIKLNYCYSNAASLCVVSFGQDNAKNSLIVLRNDDPALKQFYLKIKETDNLQVSECQQVQFSYDIFYCTATQLQDGAIVTIEVYSTNDNRLIASGLLTVYTNATPTIQSETTNTPTQIPTQTPKKTTPPYPNPSSSTPSYP